MDPFNQVYSDALGQLKYAEELLDSYRASPDTFHIEDLNNVTQELVETIHDLSQSTGAIQSNPSQYGLTAAEVSQRISQVGSLNSQLTDIQEGIIEAQKAASGSTKAPPAYSSTSKSPFGDEHERDGNGQGGSGQGMGNSLLYAEAIASQDNMLDSVSQTVSNLNQQAFDMSRELEDQSGLIEDFERHAETAQDKMRRGLKRMDWVIRNNQETLGSCCITLLIVALIVLLVLLLVL